MMIEIISISELKLGIDQWLHTHYNQLHHDAVKTSVEQEVYSEYTNELRIDKAMIDFQMVCYADNLQRDISLPFLREQIELDGEDSFFVENEIMEYIYS